MTLEQRIKNLQVPSEKIDVVLDTDAYNEVDDQFAIAYLLKSCEKLSPQAFYAAPFFNKKSSSPEDGMKRSYEEIKKVIRLCEKNELLNKVFYGSDSYLENEKTAVNSPAVNDLVERAMNYSTDKPLYVVSIGAITNIASALLIRPEIKDRIVVVWLGGNALHYPASYEFNMSQDIAAARVVMQSGVPFVQLPCAGVVSSFTISKPELLYWLKNKNSLADYLAVNAIQAAEEYAAGKPWTRVIWDVTAVAWLLNDNNIFMQSKLMQTHIPCYDNAYALNSNGHFMNYVYGINRDRLMKDLIDKLTC